ncbi:MAG: 3-demethylubiquinone-9 3-methyltransferase [Candidatus Saccharibacteria bacterium]|nr:3-demethylubiquinone-9 3-methyltransferase [Candidatus Saccharibacteria bacterium]
MQKIAPCLWYEKDAEAAMEFYVSVFNGAPVKKEESKIVRINRFPEVAVDEHMVGLEGKVSSGEFELAGQRFIAFDGGPIFKFNEAVSLFVECESQEEVDYFWSNLSAVPDAEACGWLKDKFGVSWQIIPTALGELVGNSDPEKAARSMQAMMQMKKIDIAELRRASEG